MTKEHTVTIERFPETKGTYVPRGRKLVVVDGITWGWINAEHRGMHGISYWFSYPGFSDPISRIVRGRDVEVNVWSDKHAHRELSFGTPEWNARKSLAERLLVAARALVSDGTLQSPGARKAADEQYRKDHAAARKREVDAEQKRFELHAADALLSLRSNGDAIKDNIAIIVATMRWAQTQ